MKKIPLKKIVFYIGLVLTVFACSTTPIDTQEARNCAEGFLNAVKANDFNAALQYYSTRFDEADEPEKRLEKLKKLVEVMGTASSFELTDSAHITSGDFHAIVLTYKITRPRVNSIEKFAVIKDAGSCKISSHDVKSDN